MNATDPNDVNVRSEATADSGLTRRDFFSALLRVAGLGALAGAAMLLGGRSSGKSGPSRCPNGGVCGPCPDAERCNLSTPPAKWTNREPEQR
jgi:hypothetical protein